MNIELLAHNAEAVGTYSAYIYTGSLKSAKILEEVKQVQGKWPDSPYHTHWSHLVHCFILGEFLKAHQFKNDIMDMIFDLSKTYSLDFKAVLGFGCKDMTNVWKSTRIGFPLRRLLLDQLLERESIRPFVDRFSSTPEELELLKDLACAGVMAS